MTPTRTSVLVAAALVGALAASSSRSTASGAATTPKVINVVIAHVPHHPAEDAPFFAVFSTDAPLRQHRDLEGTPRYPGAVGIDGPPAMRIYTTPAGHNHHGRRWCYAAQASSDVWHTLHVGRSYRVQITLSNEMAAPRTTRTRTIHTRTIINAAEALGC
jgi:hypothetical protein